MLSLDQKSKLEMLSFHAPKIRLLRSLNIESETVQVLDFAAFPEPEFDIPIFCANIFTAANSSIVVLDLNPLHDVISQRYYREKYYKRLHSDLASPNVCKQDEWVLCRIIHKSGEKIKPKSSFQETVPSPISLPSLLLNATQSINHINIQSQPPLHNIQHHENGLESFIINNPHFIFQPNLFPFGLNNHDPHLTTPPPPPPSIQMTDTNYHPHFNPSLLLDGGCDSQQASSFGVDSGGTLVDVAAYRGARGDQSDENWSGGC